MAELTLIQGGLGKRQVWRRPLSAGAGAITVLNGKSMGGGLRDPDGTFSIKWIPRGRAVYRTGPHSHRLDPGRSLILNPQQPYELEFPDGPVTETLCVFFSHDLVHEAWTSLGEPEAASQGDLARTPQFPELAFAPEAGIAAALAAFYAGFAADDPPALIEERAMLGLLGRLLATAQAHRLQASQLPALKAATRRALMERLLRARRMIEDSPAEEPSLDALARESALSKFHFLRLFKAAFGATPSAYAQARRMDLAKGLLCSGRPLDDIAERLGYDGAASLIRAFKRREGITPGQWRAQNRNFG